MNESLSNYLRSYRQKAALTQDEVALLLGGTHGSTITRHEEYHRVPSLDTALRYAAVYAEDPRVLFTGHYERQLRKVERQAALLLAQLPDETISDRSAFLRRLAKEPDSYLIPCEGDEC